MRILIPGIALVLLGGCVSNTVRLPNQPGGPNSDLSSTSVREQWVTEHPDTEPAMKDAIRQGVFIDGMSMDIVNLLSNPARRGTTGNGYWRRSFSGDEVRLRWFLAGEWLPFQDGQGRQVCELVLVDEAVADVRYCEIQKDLAAPAEADSAAAPEPSAAG